MAPGGSAIIAHVGSTQRTLPIAPSRVINRKDAAVGGTSIHILKASEVIVIAEHHGR